LSLGGQGIPVDWYIAQLHLSARRSKKAYKNLQFNEYTDAFDALLFDLIVQQ
jgi:hypothetical protein